MQGYATAERLSPETPPRRTNSFKQSRSRGAGLDQAVFDVLLGRLADLVVDRLMERTMDTSEAVAECLDAREAAEYLGIHRDTLRKLAAERAVPVHQDGPGCKLYFHRGELDEWRWSSRAGRSRLRAVS